MKECQSPAKYLIIIYFAERWCSCTYLLDLSDFASERTVSNVDNGSNLDGVGESSVGAGDASVVTFDGVVGDNLQVLSGNELNVLAVDEFTSADLGSLGVEHDSAGLVGALLESLSQVSDGSSVRL